VAGTLWPGFWLVWAAFAAAAWAIAVRFEVILNEHLSDPEQAAKYLTACYEEGPEVFLQGLRDVVEARGGMSQAARLAKLNRESLYRQLSRRGNPSLASLNALLTALGLKVQIAPA
jgi:probable addiction module antidote protein